MTTTDQPNGISLGVDHDFARELEKRITPQMLEDLKAARMLLGDSGHVANAVDALHAYQDVYQRLVEERHDAGLPLLSDEEHDAVAAATGWDAAIASAFAYHDLLSKVVH